MWTNLVHSMSIETLKNMFSASPLPAIGMQCQMEMCPLSLPTQTNELKESKTMDLMRWAVVGGGGGGHPVWEIILGFGKGKGKAESSPRLVPIQRQKGVKREEVMVLLGSPPPPENKETAPRTHPSFFPHVSALSSPPFSPPLEFPVPFSSPTQLPLFRRENSHSTAPHSFFAISFAVLKTVSAVGRFWGFWCQHVLQRESNASSWDNRGRKPPRTCFLTWGKKKSQKKI